MSTGKPPVSKSSSYLPWLMGGFIVLIVIGFVVGILTRKNSGSQESSACSTDTECKDPANPVCRAGVCGPRCRNRDDCNSDEICNNGTCIQPTFPCSDENPCTPPNTCQNGACVPPVIIPPCSTTNPCTPPNICQNGTCVPPCSDSNPCQDPQICIDGVCQFECTQNIQCGTSKMCEGNRCVNIDLCSTDAQCPAGRFCRNGACTRACIDDAVCPSGSKCKGGMCFQTCTGIPYECPFDHTCTGGVCVKTPCSATKLCPNTSEFKCNSGLCEPACTLTSDCTTPGHDCRAGACFKPDCPPLKLRSPIDNQCVSWFLSMIRYVPRAGYDRSPFLMYDGVADLYPCLDLCEKNRECQMVFTGRAPDGQPTCTLWSRGVNEDTTFTPGQDDNIRHIKYVQTLPWLP
jgi:hypothetical protein